MSTKKQDALGTHILLEFHGCPTEAITSSDKVEKIFLKAAEISKAHLVKTVFHHFNPHGVSGVVVISESHFAVHTWPEHKFAAIDLFSCSKDLEMDKAIDYLKKQLSPKAVSILRLDRGVL